MITRLFRQHAILRLVLYEIMIVLIGGLLLVVTSRLWLPAIGHWLYIPPAASTGQADAVVVLGGGGPERMHHGITLYKQGAAPELWYTGDMASPELPSFNQGRMGKQYAIEQGVPAEDIVLLKSTSTWEDAQAIAAMVEQRTIKRLLVVTSWYHSRRALCVVRHHLAGNNGGSGNEGGGAGSVELRFSPAPTSVYDADSWWKHEHGLVSVVNEIIKGGYYWWSYGLAPWECGR
jgi:uncharacterized SAM-binding protein YcdF (DUF218 family)